MTSLDEGLTLPNREGPRGLASGTADAVAEGYESRFVSTHLLYFKDVGAARSRAP